MPVLEGFALDADITLSELRHEDVLDARLHAHHRLRLRRRNELLGVVVDAEAWREIERYVRELEEQIERYEDAAVRALIGARSANAEFVEPSAEDVSEIDREFRALISRD
jgi:delta 1-pyrroline-5-carboxylate dehydrogenase